MSRYCKACPEGYTDVGYDGIGQRGVLLCRLYEDPGQGGNNSSVGEVLQVTKLKSKKTIQ